MGGKNYLNDIVWRRAISHNAARRYGRVLNPLLFYSKGKPSIWNGTAIAEPKSEDELSRSYPSSDERGRYRSDNLTGPRHNLQCGSPSTLPWKQYDVFAMNRVWPVPKTGRYAEYVEREFTPGYRAIKGNRDMDYLRSQLHVKRVRLSE